MMNSLAAALSLMAIGADAALRFGSCPDYSPMATFDKERYLGTWYDVQHDFIIYFQWFQSCVMADYTAIEGSDLIRVRNSAYFFGWYSAYGYAV